MASRDSQRCQMSKARVVVHIGPSGSGLAEVDKAMADLLRLLSPARTRRQSWVRNPKWVLWCLGLAWANTLFAVQGGYAVNIAAAAWCAAWALASVFDWQKALDE